VAEAEMADESELVTVRLFRLAPFRDDMLVARADSEFLMEVSDVFFWLFVVWRARRRSIEEDSWESIALII
jgi:hypothetical protein